MQTKQIVFGAHTLARLNFKDMISEIHSPREANEIYNRLANEKNFPIGVLFDWRNI